MRYIPFKLPTKFTCDANTTIDMALVQKYIDKNQEQLPRYKYLEKLYKGFHAIFYQEAKESYKPDNRLAVNFPKYITDTFLGYYIGIPVKKSVTDDALTEVLTEFDDKNNSSDKEYELSKMACIYGHSYEYMYQNEETESRIAVYSPKNCFIVYDDTIAAKYLFAVVYGYDDDTGALSGILVTDKEITEIRDGKLQAGVLNPYGLIPVTEWRHNEERMGIFESVASLMEAYNKALSEKANDVDYFADAYLAVLGAELDEDGVYKIRDNRIINLFGTDDASKIIVQFLEKPNADTTQENLIERIETLIHQVSMVANISDESFGASSGTALAYKLQAMSNLALTMERKAKVSLAYRYRLFCSLSTNTANADSWRDIDYKFSRNTPKNLLEEAQIVQSLEGVVSKETQLSALSLVESVKDEIDKMEAEEEDEKRKAVDDNMFPDQEQVDGADESRVLENPGA